MTSVTRALVTTIAAAAVLGSAGAALASDLRPLPKQPVLAPATDREPPRAATAAVPKGRSLNTAPTSDAETLRAAARSIRREAPREPAREKPTPTAALHGVEHPDGLVTRLTPWREWRRVMRVRRERRQPDLVHPVGAAPDYGDSGAAFGASRSGHTHEGQDVFAPSGTPLVAVADGEVIEAGGGDERGNHVAIYSPERDETYVYFHMVAPAEVSTGDRVSAGAEVGAVGCTGSCFGDHLHFEVHEGRGSAGPAIDPLPFLRELDG